MQFEIARALTDRLGAESVLLSYDLKSEVATRLSGLPNKNLVVGASRGPHLPVRILQQPSDAGRLAAFCRRERVDVVFEVMDNPLQRIPAVVARRAAGCKWLISVHDATRHSGEKSRTFDALAKLALVTSDGIVVYSNAVADELRPSGKPIYVTRHGAFGERSDQIRHAPAIRPVVGFFGRIARYKGLERLARAMVLVRQELPGARLKVVGSGDINPGLRSLLARADVEIVNEWIPVSDVQPHIARFDVLALPYDDASQSGVLGYALNEGVPIVATPVGGLEEQVTQCGGIVSADMSDRAFADALIGILSDPQRYSEISGSEVESARRLFGWEQVAADLENAFRRALNLS